MNSKNTLIAVAVTSALLGSGATWLLAPRMRAVSSSAQSDSHGHVHDKEAGHGEQEGKGEKDLSMSIEDILAKRCEHKTLTYECAECRYEVGVVKVDASLLKDSPRVKNRLVKTMAVSTRKVDTVLHATGEVQLNENTAAHISPRIPGIIQNVKVDIGVDVKRDDVLFEIDSVELGQALSEYEKSRALAELSRKNYEREKALVERKIGTEQEMIEAQMTYEQHEAELRAAEQKLRVLGLGESAAAALKAGPHRLGTGRLPVCAPFDGTIIEKHAVIGELVEPGKDVMLIADLRAVWVWASVYEQDLRMLLGKKPGSIPVKVSVHAFPGRAFNGTMDYIGATMDEKTRTVKVRARVINEERLLRPGMFCEVQAMIAGERETLAIPRAALLSDEGHHFVFKRLKDDYYVRRPVKKGQGFDEAVEVLDGLKVGDVIVADGSFLLKSDVLRSKMGAGCAD